MFCVLNGSELPFVLRSPVRLTARLKIWSDAADTGEGGRRWSSKPKL